MKKHYKKEKNPTQTEKIFGTHIKYYYQNILKHFIKQKEKDKNRAKDMNGHFTVKGKTNGR